MQNSYELTIGRPNEKQALALKEKHKHVGYGGARGGGKSWFVRTKAKLLAVNFPGIHLMIVRRSYPELTQNHINPLINELACGSKNSICKYNKSEKTMTFVNGSTILFNYCNVERDLKHYQGTEVDVLFIDEATQFPELWIKKIVACVRGVNQFPKRIYYTCNPGGEGHGYIKRIFIDKKYLPGEREEEYAFIQALVTDNKVLMESDPDYIHQLEALPGKLKKAWLEGSWDIFEGQFFEEFRDLPEHYEDHQWTHVIEPFEIPKDWAIYMSYDFGYSKPFSFQWWAVSRDGCAYLIVEFYGCTGEPNEGLKWTAKEQFEKVRDIEAMHPLLKDRKIIGRVADPAIWNAEYGESIQETAAKARIYFQKADNARIAGWMQMHYRMSFDKNGRAMMYVFNTCKHFIRTIPLMSYSEHTPEDLDTELEDHIADSTRYFCMMRPISPPTTEVKHQAADDPLNQRSGSEKKVMYSYSNI